MSSERPGWVAKGIQGLRKKAQQSAFSRVDAAIMQSSGVRVLTIAACRVPDSEPLRLAVEAFMESYEI
jgi:hypothetical protein